MLCLVQYLTFGVENSIRMDAVMKDRVKQRTEEIMQPGSKYMKKISAKIQEMMKPESKYMKKINKRLGQNKPGKCKILRFTF